MAKLNKGQLTKNFHINKTNTAFQDLINCIDELIGLKLPLSITLFLTIKQHKIEK